jgi:hypothetical protein
MKGDTKWVETQRYGANNTTPLFRKAPKWEKKEDANSTSDLSPSVIRLQRIFEKAGNESRDPIGLWSHFCAWIEKAKTGVLPFPVLFLNMNEMSGRNNTGIRALKRFVNVSNLNEDDFSYKPSKRKNGDIILVIIRVNTRPYLSKRSPSH